MGYKINSVKNEETKESKKISKTLPPFYNYSVRALLKKKEKFSPVIFETSIRFLCETLLIPIITISQIHNCDVLKRICFKKEGKKGNLSKKEEETNVFIFVH